jgi:anti-anti-sigma regulatory factor
MATGVTTRRVQDIDFIDFTPDPAVELSTAMEPDRPVDFSTGAEDPSPLVLPVLKALLEKGSKKLVLNLSNVALVTDPVARLAQSAEDLANEEGASLLLLGTPAVLLEAEGASMVSEDFWVWSEEEAVEFFNPRFRVESRQEPIAAGEPVVVHELIGDLKLELEARQKLIHQVLFNSSVLDFSKVQVEDGATLAAMKDRLALRLVAELQEAGRAPSKGDTSAYERPEKLTARLVKAPQFFKDTVYGQRVDSKDTSHEKVFVKLQTQLPEYGITGSASVEFLFFDSLDKALASFTA